MDTIEDICKYVRKKRNQGYEGYGDLKQYFKKFNLDQLVYIKDTLETKQKSMERLREFREITTLSVAVIAVIFSVVPDTLKENLTSFSEMLLMILLFSVLCLVIFFFLDHCCSRKIDDYTIALKIIEEVEKARDLVK